MTLLSREPSPRSSARLLFKHASSDTYLVSSGLVPSGQRAWLTLFAIFLIETFASLSLMQGQTRAQVALMNEPEILNINKGTAQLQNDQTRTDFNAPTRGQVLMEGYVNFRATPILLRQLHDRLEENALKCHYCAPMQEELSELLRQELTMAAADRAFMQERGASKEVMELFGVSTDDRWHNKERALDETRGVISSHCNRVLPYRGPSDAARNTERQRCFATTAQGPYTLVSEHDQVWSSCFKQHDWVRTPSQRGAYESCMSEDPLVKFCAGEAAETHTRACKPLQVGAADVEPLRSYQNRWHFGSSGSGNSQAPTSEAPAPQCIIHGPAGAKRTNDTLGPCPASTGAASTGVTGGDSRIATAREPIATDVALRAKTLFLPANTFLPLIVVDAIELRDVQAGKLFHCQLGQDAILVNEVQKPAQAKLAAGTDVYLKGVLENANTSGSNTVKLTIDHLIVNGMTIPMVSSPIRKPVSLQSTAAQGIPSSINLGRLGAIPVPRRRTDPQPSVVLEAGSRTAVSNLEVVQIPTQ